MSAKSDSEMGINSWLEDELYQQYLHDRSTVDESWKQVFAEANAGQRRALRQRPRSHRARGYAAPLDGEELQPLRGIARQDRREHGREPRDSAGDFAAHHRRSR